MDVSPAGNGTVQVDEEAPEDYPFTFDIKSGTTVELEAVSAPGYRFEGWSGALSDSVNPATLVMDCNKKVTAIFSQITHTLTLRLKGDGTITPEAGEHEFSDGATIDISAVPDSDWQFEGWSGDVTDSTAAITTLTLDSDKTITASFSKSDTFQVNWNLTGGIVGGLAAVILLAGIIVARRRAQ